MSRRLSELGLRFILLILIFASPARADIVDCTGQVDLPGYKVLLDDITYYGSGNEDERFVDFILERLRFRLETDLQRLVATVETGEERASLATDPDDVSLKVLRCDGRSPRGEGDFDDDLVDLLRAHDVLVEVWGMVIMAENAEGERQLEGLVSYLMPPMRAQSGAPGSGFQQAEYVVEQNTTTLSLDRLFTDSADLRVFSAISIGLTQLELGRYDQARRSFCRARGLLDSGSGPNAAGLKQYVDELSIEVVTRARNDAGYRGLLRLEGIGGCDENG
ncbi:MAG: hypothetical protein GY835_07910 [bacterium]|nr:hypothetical protein [bacterium]